MPRQARSPGSSGFFHVIVRGNAKQLIFEEDDDRRFFLNRMMKYSAETGVAICAYCLMENHVHLLLRDNSNALAQFMKKLNGSYARFFNWKYERTGHLFQDRYKSEPIEDDSYFLSVLRYILCNPESAGICSASTYPWSSYKQYNGDQLVDTTFIRGLLPTREEYEEFILKGNGETPNSIEPIRKDDAWAKTVIRETAGVENGSAIQSFDRKRRDQIIALLLDKGLSERQIERLTGISRYIIRNIVW